MATTHAPSLQSHAWSFALDNSSLKPDKIDDDESEFHKWLNVDNFPPINNSDRSGSLPSSYNPQAHNIANAISLVSSSAMYQPFVNNNNTSSSVNSFNPQSFSQFPIAISLGNQSLNGMNQQLNLIPLPLVSGQANGNNIPSMIVLPNFGFPNQQQLTVNPQFYSLMFTQFQNLRTPSSPSSSDESSDEPKKKGQKGPQRRVRQTRPKVVEAKGAVQCVGRNRKKNSQCRNAALMEYIGPRPLYCAEHIELDPNSLYEKCKSPYQKELDDKKGCKEVVLKEFGLCYKHYGDTVAELVKSRDEITARKHFDRITELLEQLEREAAAAKKKDGDLYQRKNKLIPKFQEMKKVIAKGLEELQTKEVDDLRDELSAPVFFKLAQQNAAECVDASFSPYAHANALSAGHSPSSDLDHTKILEDLS